LSQLLRVVHLGWVVLSEAAPVRPCHPSFLLPPALTRLLVVLQEFLAERLQHPPGELEVQIRV